MIEDGRVHFVASADYSTRRDIDTIAKAVLDKITSNSGLDLSWQTGMIECHRFYIKVSCWVTIACLVTLCCINEMGLYQTNCSHKKSYREGTKTYVYKVLTNEAYCGTLVLGGRPGYKAIRSGETPVRVENAWPTIIDKETFLSVQQKMTSRRPTAVHPRVLPSFHLLSGILFCSCGRAMIGRRAKSHQYYYYTCNRKLKEGSDSCHTRSLPKKNLERIVTEHIKSKILNDDVLEKLVALVNQDLDNAHSSYREKLEVLDAEVKDVSSRLATLYDALETGKLEGSRAQNQGIES